MFWKLQENVLNDSDLNNLTDFIKTTKRFTQFEKVKEFEEKFAKWQGVEYSVYVNSGSSANLIMINSLKEMFNWPDKSEVLVPTVTWSTNVSPIIQNSLTPVFVDINLEDLSFNYSELEAKICEKTVAIFVTHLLGKPSNLSILKNLAKKYNLVLIEDCCEAQGATYGNSKVGNFGLASTFSFYWGHHMTTVEGGMVCTNDDKLHDLLLLKRSHGLARELSIEKHNSYRSQYPNIDFNFLFLTDGFNVRNTEINAVFGISQLRNVDNYIEIRKKNYIEFISILNKYSDHFIIIDPDGMSPLCLPFVLKRNELMPKLKGFLEQSGIETRPIISGNLLLQPFLKKYYKNNEFCKSDFLHNNGFYIGNNQFVDNERIRYLSQKLDVFFEKM